MYIHRGADNTVPNSLSHTHTGKTENLKLVHAINNALDIAIQQQVSLHSSVVYTCTRFYKSCKIKISVPAMGERMQQNVLPFNVRLYMYVSQLTHKLRIIRSICITECAIVYT